MKKTGLIFLVIGVTFITIQNIFYGDLDANGYVQDSLFLPLGAISIIIGALLIIIFGIKVSVTKLLNKQTK
jgi:hypothetical protein